MKVDPTDARPAPAGHWFTAVCPCGYVVSARSMKALDAAQAEHWNYRRTKAEREAIREAEAVVTLTGLNDPNHWKVENV